MRKFMSVLIVVLLSLTSNVYAAGSFNASLSSKQIEPNGTFNIVLSGNSVGRVDIKVNNGNCSSTSIWYEEKTQTISCSAGNAGVVTITVTPQRGFSDSDGNLYSPGVKNLSVEIKKKEITEPTTKTTTKAPTTKSTAKVTTNKRTTTSTKVNEKSTIINTQKNTTTKAGSTTLAVDKKDVFTYNDKEINLSEAELDSSLEQEGISITNIKIGNTNYPALKIKDNYLLRSDDDVYYLYDSNLSKFINKVNLLNINNRQYFIDNDIDNATAITVGNKTMMGEKLEDRYYKIRVLNNKGEFVYYVYETTEESMQLFSSSLFTCADENCEEINDKTSLYVVIVGLVFFIVGLLIFVYFKLWRK